MEPPDRDWTVRRASAADAGTLAALTYGGLATYRSFGPPGWTPPADAGDAELFATFLARDSNWALVAEHGDEPLGVVRFLPAAESTQGADEPAQAHLAQLFLVPAAWGTGLAVTLMASAVAEMRTRGFRRARLFAAAGQDRARRFYEREGWTTDGTDRDDGRFGMPLVRYARDL